jgi:ectoine hydroxylase-related dioxygenase (phytanoyl-CoA dioxygenase family)
MAFTQQQMDDFHRNGYVRIGEILEDDEIAVLRSKAVAIELPAGGAMIHHCQTLHYTAPNTTDRQRRAFAIHFMTPGTRRTRQDTDGVIDVSFANPILRSA